MSYRVAVLVGSLRKDSITLKVARALMQSAPSRLSCSLVNLGDLPLYNEDLEDKAPEPWTRLRGEIAKADAVLFLTPEYNRSVPGCLKNALDVGSRPEGKSVWNNKPSAIVSVTPHKLGAFGANHALRQSFVFLNSPAMQQPEAYIGNAAELFGKDGKLKDDEQKKFFEKFMKAFADWIGRVAPASHFERFMQRREEAAKAYVRGDAGPVLDISPEHGSATFFPPNGGSVIDAAKVTERYAEDAKSFANDATSRFEILQQAASGDTAFWTGFQIADVKMDGKRVPMKLRITELFRFIDGDWKLVHRHADRQAEATH